MIVDMRLEKVSNDENFLYDQAMGCPILFALFFSCQSSAVTILMQQLKKCTLHAFSMRQKNCSGMVCLKCGKKSNITLFPLFFFCTGVHQTAPSNGKICPRQAFNLYENMIIPCCFPISFILHIKTTSEFNRNSTKNGDLMYVSYDL
jgi:hypothetical protein